MAVDGTLLVGGEGNDSLSRTAGDDSLFGGVGDDTLRGADGNDLLSGGLGRNLVDGGAGAEVLAGGMGADVFRFDDGNGLDVVLDFNRGAGDRIAIAGNINGTGIDHSQQIVIFHGPEGSLVYLGEFAGAANWIAVTGVTDLYPQDFVIV